MGDNPGRHEIHIATSSDDLARCYPVMHELRIHLSLDDFLAQVGRQQESAGYRLAALTADGRVCCLAGFRISEWLAWGRAMYVDDLVTSAAARSCGYGAAMFAWLRDYARREGCGAIHLDSGVQRFDAHRFYLRERMRISSHHFALDLGGAG